MSPGRGRSTEPSVATNVVITAPTPRQRSARPHYGPDHHRSVVGSGPCSCSRPLRLPEGTNCMIRQGYLAWSTTSYLVLSEARLGEELFHREWRSNSSSHASHTRPIPPTAIW